MSKKSILKDSLFFISLLVLFSIVFYFLVPQSNAQLTKNDFLENETAQLHYVALGDSLTQGTGDTTNQGGFVSLLSDHLESDNKYQVTSSNFGVAGNTSQQILKRMTKDETILPTIKEADFMTLTVGGNDVMAVIKKNLSQLEISSFDQPQKDYQKRLRQIIDLARKENDDLPIYILGIYNPFYLNFPEIVEMQEIIDKWNEATATVASEYENIYFVPINDQLYKGYNGKEGIVETNDSSTSVINNALFEEDHFHPNNIGYQIIANAMMEKINETRDKW
ncbi:SGNH/GDSL hydrolase family protein [Streptococcus sp. CSL10205-OR2]|uniref:SGNH/GDSL hydrolase family protein n=1 Tax=Streptococcus sp. CSL10205-OR2 TaxID=2980558 RepID=UPI0021DB7E7C|nr:SGNH/GDSL hydrolase family protein [Streptococcus sp. CSL10205-OR2]MCU9534270.1 SGNH/GDSL hydrolase family protein [Streptococcus sp. CSL10205-OR2]